MVTERQLKNGRSKDIFERLTHIWKTENISKKRMRDKTVDHVYYCINQDK